MDLTREEVRSLDRRAVAEFGVPGVVLMENAGRSMAELLRHLGIGGSVVICCGKGNNGGDGFVLARYLDNARVEVAIEVFARPEDITGDAATAHHIVARAGLALTYHGSHPHWPPLRQRLQGARWIVDALFGTGLTGPVRPPFGDVIEAINSAGVGVLSVDLPSGLDCDRGVPMGPTVRADHTATMAAAKRGFAFPEAAPWVGKVHVMDIGVPRRLLQELAGRPAR